MNGPGKSLLGLLNSITIDKSISITIITHSASKEFLEYLPRDCNLTCSPLPKRKVKHFFKRTSLRKKDFDRFNLIIIWTHHHRNLILSKELKNKESKFAVVYHQNVNIVSKNVINKFLHFFDYHLFISEDSYKDFKKLFPKYKNFAHLLTNTIIKPYINNSINLIDAKLNNNIKKVVSIGGVRKQKNYRTLLDSIKIVKSKLNVEFEIYGHLNSDDKKVIKYAKKRKLNDVFKGSTNTPIDVIYKCDLYVNSSLYEGLSISVLEAMYLKKPLVLSKCYGNNVILKNCNYAFGFNRNDHIQLANLIINIIKNDLQISKEDHNHAKSYISSEKINNQFSYFIKSITD